MRIDTTEKSLPAAPLKGPDDVKIQKTFSFKEVLAERSGRDDQNPRRIAVENERVDSHFTQKELETELLAARTYGLDRGLRPIASQAGLSPQRSARTAARSAMDPPDVARIMVASPSNGRAAALCTLHTEELGTIQILARQTADGIEARLATTACEVGSLLNKHSEELEERLLGPGGGSSVDVEVASDGGSGSLREAFQQHISANDGGRPAHLSARTGIDDQIVLGTS